MCKGAEFCKFAYETVVRGLRLADKPTLSRSEFNMCMYSVFTDPSIRRYVIMVIGWCVSARMYGCSGSPPIYQQACLR